MTPHDAACPCGSGDVLAACCGPRLDGTSPAPTAEALMRSRYTAFVRGDRAYLLATWHPGTRPPTLVLPAGRRWLRLEITEIVDGGLFAPAGVVAFRAHYRDRGARGVQAERSRFTREGGRWFYLDGAVDP